MGSYIPLWLGDYCSQSDPHSAQSSPQTHAEGQLEISLRFLSMEKYPSTKSIKTKRIKTKPRKPSGCPGVCIPDVWYLSDSFRHLNMGAVA